MKVSEIFEATRPYSPKALDPALLTFDEYHKILNPSKKVHPPNAYDSDIDNLTRIFKKDEFTILLNNIKVNGLDFQVRMRKNKKVFVKTNDQGNIVNDKKGLTKYLTDKEIEEQGIQPFDFTIAVFNSDDETVASVADEWGAVLVEVAKEYRGFGFGQILSKLARDYEPGKGSGGETPAGLDMLRKVHGRHVQDYLSSGLYSYLIRKDKISKEKVKQIISSAWFPSKRKEVNLQSDNPKDWLLNSSTGAVILYNRKLKDLLDSGDVYNERNHHFAEKMILGMVFAADSHEYTRIRIFGGETDKIKKFLMMCALTQSKEDNKPLVVEPEDIQYVDSKTSDISEMSKIAGYDSYIVTYKGKSVNIEDMSSEERRFRKQFDKYGEFETMVLELAHAKYQQP